MVEDNDSWLSSDCTAFGQLCQWKSFVPTTCPSAAVSMARSFVPQLPFHSGPLSPVSLRVTPWWLPTPQMDHRLWSWLLPRGARWRLLRRTRTDLLGPRSCKWHSDPAARLQPATFPNQLLLQLPLWSGQFLNWVTVKRHGLWCHVCKNLFLVGVTKVMTTRAFAGPSSLCSDRCHRRRGSRVVGGWSPPLPEASSRAVHPLPGRRNGTNKQNPTSLYCLLWRVVWFKHYSKAPAYFTKHNVLNVPPCCIRWQDFLLF